MEKGNNEDSSLYSDTLISSDEEMMEPLNFSTKREKSPVATFGNRISHISPSNKSYIIPSYSQSSSASDFSNAAVTVGDSLPSSSGTLSPLRPLIPLARTQMDTSLSSSPEIHVNRNSLSIERVRSLYSQPNMLARSPTSAENVSVHSNSGMNLGALKESSKRSTPPEIISRTSSPRNSFIGNPYLNPSGWEPSADAKEYYNNNTSGDNNNIRNNPLVQSEAASSPSTLLNLQAFQNVLMYSYQNNPLLFLHLRNFINQNGADVLPTTSLLSSHFPLLAPHLSIPTTVPPLLSIEENPYLPDLNDEARSQVSSLQLRAESLRKEQVGRKRRRRNLQNPKGSSDIGNKDSKEKGESSRARKKENDNSIPTSEECNSDRALREEGDSGKTPMEEGSSSSEEDTKSKSGSTRKVVKDEAYWEYRRKNNEAAKRSRDAQRAKENATKIRRDLLLVQNHVLRKELDELKESIEVVQEIKILLKRRQHWEP